MNCLSSSLVGNLMHWEAYALFQATNERNTVDLKGTSTGFEARAQSLSPLSLAIVILIDYPSVDETESGDGKGVVQTHRVGHGETHRERSGVGRERKREVQRQRKKERRD